MDRCVGKSIQPPEEAMALPNESAITITLPDNGRGGKLTEIRQQRLKEQQKAEAAAGRDIESPPIRVDDR
ncbi:MAG: hypothetical protein N2C12_09565 [Planctomycetales bacterium]